MSPFEGPLADTREVGAYREGDRYGDLGSVRAPEPR